MQQYIVAIPAYNEEKTIERCIDSIFTAAQFCKDDFSLQSVLVCVNACTDKTEERLEKITKRYKNIRILKEPTKGYIYAIQKIIKTARSSYPDAWIVKIDADSEAQRNSFSILLLELKYNKNIFIAGGHPIPNLNNLSTFKRLLAHVLTIRAQFPRSEIARRRVDPYHPDIEKYKQPIDSTWEKRSKIYFHGRFWAAKNVDVLKIPSSQIGDDVYLTAYIYKNFGPGKIRVRYDANCLFIPTCTIKHHWKTYRRIYEDIALLKKIKGLQWYAEESRTKLDWQYIFKLPARNILAFTIYNFFRHIEEITFHLVPYRNTIWEYETKVHE